jgi:hypothetical protein
MISTGVATLTVKKRRGYIKKVSTEKSDNDKEWYSNQQLFELYQRLSEELVETRYELQITRNMMKSYNGLRELVDKLAWSVDKVMDDVAYMKAEGAGKKKVFDGIISYGGWFMSVILFLFTLLKYLSEGVN